MVRGSEDLVVYDDEIDLRAYVAVLLKWKWVIAGIVVLATAAAGLLSFTVLTPTYEATQFVALPAAQGQTLLEGRVESRLGMSAKAYQEFATSLTVMEDVHEVVASRSESPTSPTSLQRRFEVTLDQGAGLLKVSARASTAEEAYRLAQAWLAAFQNQVTALLQRQVLTSLEIAEEQLDEARAAFSQAQAALEAFDQVNGVRVLEARLTQMEDELTTAEARLRSLETQLLPSELARLEYLESAIASEPRFLDGPASVPEPSAGTTLTGTLTTLNPAHLRLSEELSVTRSLVASYVAEIEALRRATASLPDEIAALRKNVVSLQAERDQLTRELHRAESRFTEALGRRESLRPLVARIQDLAQIVTVSAATLPERPVAPRPVLNMAVAAVLAGFMAVFYVSLREWWQAGHSETDPASGAAAVAPASHQGWEAGR